MAYNPIKRIRSWFFDNNIPTEPRVYTDSNGNNVTKKVKTRLAKGHFAKEETFKDLLETTFMKSSGSDLQDVASTNEIYEEVNIEKVVKPNQLPELEEVISTIDFSTPDTLPFNPSLIYTGEVYDVTKRKNGSKNKYSWKFSNNFLGWLLPRLLPKGGTPNQVLTKGNTNDFLVEWRDIPIPANILPQFAGADRILHTNTTNNGAEWRNRDYYNQTEINGFRTIDNNARINGDTTLQTEIDSIETGAGLQSNGAYSPNITTPIINTATSLNNADVLLANNLNGTNNVVQNIIRGASLPQSSLLGLQNQINNLGGNTTQSILLPVTEPRILSSFTRFVRNGVLSSINGNFIWDINGVFNNGENIVINNNISTLPSEFIPLNSVRGIAIITQPNVNGFTFLATFVLNPTVFIIIAPNINTSFPNGSQISISPTFYFTA